MDEVEKAHPGVQDVFFQVFDKGARQCALRRGHHGDGQTCRRLPGVGGGIVEGVEYDSQDQQAVDGPCVRQIAESCDEGGGDALLGK